MNNDTLDSSSWTLKDWKNRREQEKLDLEQDDDGSTKGYSISFQSMSNNLNLKYLSPQ